MSVSAVLEKSAKDFCLKYACNFDFNTFESSLEEFLFLSSDNGWHDVYKTVFERMYLQALESVARIGDVTLDSEAMLDDFEYTLIRPYVNEGTKEIKHTPYVGMDRVARLEYLQLLTSQSPSNSVDLYAKKYKNGELSIKEIRSKFEQGKGDREHYIELAGCVQALENVSKSRSLIWRVLHPFKNSAEKRSSAGIKRAFAEQTQGGEEFYTEATAAAYQTFGGHQKVNANLEQNMLRAREELSRKKKMDDAIRESIRVEGFEKDYEHLRSPMVESNDVVKREKQL